MSLARPITFWIVVLVGGVVAVVLLHGILLPFVAGMVLAYLLDPLATRLERFGFNRVFATLLIVGAFIVGSVALVFLTAPFFVGEMASLVDSLPLYIRRLHGLATDPNRPWLSKIVGEGLSYAEKSIGELTTLASDWLGTFLRSVWSGGETFIGVLSVAFVTPIVACYLINDWNKVVGAVDRYVPPAHRETVRGLAREMDGTIGGFVRGQGTLCLVMALFYAVALSLIGLHHAVLIGIIAGLISFVPYLGSLTGLAASSFVAIAQFWPSLFILMVPAIFFVGQSLSDNVLSPYLVGRRVDLNPVWMMFALFAFGYLFGFVGLLIAVPLAAAIGVLVRFATRQYCASPIFHSAPAPLPSTVQPVGDLAALAEPEVVVAAPLGVPSGN